jgi:D-3-phosphoglycerate dehydrogenase
VLYQSWLDTKTLQDPDVLGPRLAREGIDYLIVEADFVFREVFDAAPNLRWLGICRNALNHVDLDAATGHGVVVSHARGRNTNAVAEMTLGLMLDLARGITRAHTLVSGGGWRDPSLGYRMMRGREIAGSTVGVVGFGQIGREVARKCIVLGARVLVFDPYVPAKHVEALGAKTATLPVLAKSSDFVTVHTAENRGTHQMINAAFFERMRPHAYFLNTSAGSVVDHNSLIEALHAGRIAGAALDVFDGHPLPTSSPLMSTPNLILIPHIAGATAETIDRHSRLMTQELERLLDNKPLRLQVNNPPRVD